MPTVSRPSRPCHLYSLPLADTAARLSTVEFVFENLVIEVYQDGQPVDMLISELTLEYWPISKKRTVL